MIRRVIYTVFIFIILCTSIFGIIAYAKGYRFNANDKKLTTTGIMSVSSYPDKASILLDGKLVGVSSTSLSLSPKWYDVKITKEGYQAWEKRIRLQGEIVSQVDALLIPANPSLRTLTVNGVVAPVLSPSRSRVAYIIPSEASSSSVVKSRTGLWVFDLRTGPFGTKNEPKQIFEPKSHYDWSFVKLYWSPDEKQVIITFIKTDKKKDTVIQALQVPTEGNTNYYTDITNQLNTIFADWKIINQEKKDAQINALPVSVTKLLTKSVDHIDFAPDESKILYLATSSSSLETVINPPLIGSNPTEEKRSVKPGNYYIYDEKEDKNYFISEAKNLTSPEAIIWYSDSKHVVTIESGSIFILDFDGTNRRTVYAGPFVDNIIFPWPSGERLAILTNLNNTKAFPNLYELDLR